MPDLTPIIAALLSDPEARQRVREMLAEQDRSEPMQTETAVHAVDAYIESLLPKTAEPDRGPWFGKGIYWCKFENGTEGALDLWTPSDCQNDIRLRPIPEWSAPDGAAVFHWAPNTPWSCVGLVRRGVDGGWLWQVVGADGRVVAVPGRMFDTNSAARAACEEAFVKYASKIAPRGEAEGGGA